VQPAARSDGWNTEPFEFVIKDDKMFGRGSTDDKGPVLAWLNIIESFQKTANDIPINIKFCFEGMEESGSTGLEEALAPLKDTFLADVDYTYLGQLLAWQEEALHHIRSARHGLLYAQRQMC
jgi:nonspecific dipeptidase